MTLSEFVEYFAKLLEKPEEKTHVGQYVKCRAGKIIKSTESNGATVVSSPLSVDKCTGKRFSKVALHIEASVQWSQHKHQARRPGGSTWAALLPKSK